MKRDLIYLTLIVSAIWAAHATAKAVQDGPQQIEPRKIEAGFTKTVHILFPSPVTYIDIGSMDIIAGKADGAENVVRVKAAVRNFAAETNLTVITEDGGFFTFDVHYAENPVVSTLNLTVQEPQTEGVKKPAAADDPQPTASEINTVYILKRANKKTLALFDELGAGTDPTEGAALAIAILDNLHNRNVTAMATTHYSELKIYALSTDGVENASCEFDVESLQPTYRLLVGVPGKSNAFAISGKLGLPKEIIDEAGKLVDSDSRSFEDVVTGLEDARTAAEKEREKAKKIREEAEHFRDKMKAKNERIDAAKDKILRRANEEAHEIIQKAKDTADESIRKYNKWMKGSGMTKEMEKERANLRKALNETESELTIEKTKKVPKKAPDKLQIGDIVMVHSMGIKGTVSTLPNSKGKCFVQMGILRSEVSVSDLELLEQETKAAKKEASITHARNMKMAKAMTISPEINLIGKTVDEALFLLDKYLDDAYLAKLHQVTIIHGVGTGALRNAVQNHCKKSKYVKSYRMGEYGEGGYGVTVVEFK